MKKVLAFTLTSLLAITLFACANQTPAPNTQAATEAVTEAATEVAAQTQEAQDGIFTTSVPGMNDTVEVALTLSGGAIARVEVTKHQETPGIGGPLYDASGKELTAGGEAPTTLLPRLMVERQSVNIDAITGATITSKAINKAARECLTKAGVASDKFNEAIHLPMQSHGDTYDVVVVGGGGTGLAAAISAKQNGAKVLVVEKNGEVGGDTLVCGAIYNTPDEELQAKGNMGNSEVNAIKAAIERAKTGPHANQDSIALANTVEQQLAQFQASGKTGIFDTKELYALQTWDGGDYVANINLVKTLCNVSFEGMKWVNALGMQFEDVISQGAGSLWQRTHTSVMQMGTGFISTYVSNLEGIDVVLNTKGVKLNADETGRVVSVDCENINGEKYTVNATKGVVITTGGFAANGDLVEAVKDKEKWGGVDLSEKATTNRAGCSQGDGITLVEGVGGDTVDMDQIQLLYLGNIKDGQLTKYPPRDVNGTDQIIFVNKEGNRFTNEGGRRDNICLDVFKQTDSVFFMLESGDGAGYKDIHDPSWRSADGFTFDYLVNNEFVYYGETLEELCQKVGWDVNTIQATLDKFNSYARGESEDEFGRTLKGTELVNGPWVATPRQACVHHTMGGIRINEECCVLNKEGNVIPGLYAAGETTGGIHGGNRLGGNAVVDTVVFGKIAGQSAATK